ncbi:hypothetical protein G6F70_000728 [Rhizopus microsporus]|nr:hypothetical protein G6F71_004471 [Rhizopus microsporus]KAG1204157.1 hypothetical protein G6F70_000728 [Rhizopus microsporus]KAG1209332.1 hypothetical protein G6F69_006452 [Rhizopus microsporus]KAG1230734.1 hypothetical protein G6F67_006254 [Rhizopus microsporus]KAG1263708.1 hypothetical protein G6F68_004936 [Rhizopus microsporus]
MDDTKKKLRQLNKLAWEKEKGETPKNLDSNIKKNTAFIKKCKTSLGADMKTQLLNDINKLTLEKYISEIVGSVLEGMLKCKTSVDVSACVEVISALHQRFPDTFTLLLSGQLSKSLQPPNKQYLATLSAEQREKEESARITKQRTYLRIACELWLVGVLRSVSDGKSVLAANMNGVETHRDGVAGFVNNSTSATLSNDTDHHVNLPLVASFLKNYGQTILGIVPRKQKAAAEQHSESVTVDVDPESVVTPDIHALLMSLMQDYYKTISTHLTKVHKAIKKMERHNNEILFARGELSEENKQRFEKASKTYEKLLSHTQTLADALNEEMPDLPENEVVNKPSSGMVSSSGNAFQQNGGENVGGQGVWEDDDARKFYEDLPDLRILVPDVFLEDQPAKKNEDQDKEQQQQPEEEEIIESGNNDDVDPLEEAIENVEDAAGEEDSTMKPTQAAQLEGFFARLPQCANRDLIDAAVVDFCYMNNKNARKKLVKTLLKVQRQRLDLLPYYSRFIAILNNYFPDIGEMVITALTYEFKGLQRRKNQDLIESRVKNIRFLSELTKFRVTPPHTIFYAFKVALDDFTSHNIDIVCNLLECCGRFLLRSPDTSARMSTMLETVMRKKTVQHLDSRYSLMVENAYYQANPPDKPAVQIKERTPMELYIRKLIHEDLCKKSLDKVLKQLRKLHWEDVKIRQLLVRIFQKIWKIKFSNIHLMAILASGLNRYHSDFGVQIVDGIIEEIRLGLEQNIFKHNQRRIAVVKYLGELYNYRMIESPLIFDTLYTIVTFGHEYGRPARERFCPIDTPNDFFRIRLCCTLLDTCGMCFDRGSSKKKLDNFLVFFQMYVLSKSKPPMDIDFMISDTFEMLRPQLTIIPTYEQANEAVDRMLLEQLKSIQGADKVQEDGFDESGEGSDTSSVEDEDEEANRLDEEDEEGQDEPQNAPAETDEDDVVVLKKKQEQISREDEEDFEREFNKMMTDSIESRKFEKKTAMLDVPIPMNLRGSLDRRTAVRENEKPETGKMAFTLLTKKGNRQQTKIMEIPSDSVLAVSTRSKQEAEREEQKQLKQLVLNYEEREEAAARQAAVDERNRIKGATRGKKVLYVAGGASLAGGGPTGKSNW